MLQNMNFKEQWNKIPPDQRDEFIAYQVYMLDKRLTALGVCVDELKKQRTLAGGITGGLSGIVGGGLIMAVNYIGQKLKMWQ